jgi:hypothetical protein
MGTRSRIGVMHGDVCKSVYCHWDGYLEHNGEILQKHYDSSKANQLVALGNLSSLQAQIGVEHPFDYHGADMSADEYNAKFRDMCTFYGRDRGETDSEWKVAHTFEEFLEQCNQYSAVYYYIMRDGVWYVGDTYGETALSNQLKPLADALEHIAEPDSETQADLNETLGLDRNTPLEDLVARIEELDGSWETVDL